MAKQELDVQQGDPPVAEPVVEPIPAEAASTEETFTKEDVQAMIAEAQVAATRDASEEAFRRAQSKIDQDTARLAQAQSDQYAAFVDRYGKALTEHGAEPEIVEGLAKQTRTEIARQQELRELEDLRKYKASTEADQARRDYVVQQCTTYKIDQSDKRLDTSSPEAFNGSILQILADRLERRDRDAEREQKKKDLEALQAAGGLDVTGGGAAMAAAAWSTDKLALHSVESTISEYIMHDFNKPMTVAELGQRTQKAMQLMKSDPALANNPRKAAKRVYEMETFGR